MRFTAPQDRQCLGGIDHAMGRIVQIIALCRTRVFSVFAILALALILAAPTFEAHACTLERADATPASLLADASVVDVAAAFSETGANKGYVNGGSPDGGCPDCGPACAGGCCHAAHGGLAAEPRSGASATLLPARAGWAHSPPLIALRPTGPDHPPRS